MKEKLVTKNDIKKAIPALNNKFGDIVIGWAMRLIGLHKANDLYDGSKQYEGSKFCENLLNDIGVNFIVENKEVLNQFAGKPFITVSNHPYGHIDGIALVKEIGSVRPDYKIMANLILGMIDTIAMHFILVNPYKGKGEMDSSNLDGVKQYLDHIQKGHPFGFFPAGAVAKAKHKQLKISTDDLEWKKSTVRLIQKANVPVIPVHFSGHNSRFYYFLNHISWKLSSVRLPREIFNKKGKTVCMRFGEAIMPDELAFYKNINDFSLFLRAKTYELA